MARDVDDVIDPAGDPVIAVGIALAAISGEVLAGIGCEIGLEEAFVITPDCAHLARPAVGNAKVAFAGAFQRFAFAIDDLGFDAKHGEAGRSRF